MVYTLTLNPSIDYVVHLDEFISGITNRTSNDEYYIGGKGINVSFILSQLNIENKALGFTAGFTGGEIENKLRELGILFDFVRLKSGISRINIKIKTEKISEINGQGPHISENEFEQLLLKTDLIKDGDTIVLAGSIPKSLPENTYDIILKRLKDRQVRIAVDAEKRLLLQCLSYKPFLIKPNRQELSDIFGRDIKSEREIALCAKELMKTGAKNVIVSLGQDGALLFAENGETYRSGVVDEKVYNTVGAGDSMVAGFIAGYEQKRDYNYAFRLGTACGNATAFSKWLASNERIFDVLSKL